MLPAPGQARDDWRIPAQVAGRMGWGDAFAWPDAAAVFREHAALSVVAGTLGSDFDISDLAGLGNDGYAALAPYTWPQNRHQRGGRFFGTGQFHTDDGRARMLPITARLPASVSAQTPFRLNTGRIRDQWHTMTRIARSPRLAQHPAEPSVEVNPADAERLGLVPADLVRVENHHGTAILRVPITENVAAGAVFVPMHWTGEKASAARIDALVPALVDPVPCQPDSKTAAVALHRFAVSSGALVPGTDYRAKSRVLGGMAD